VDLTDDLRTRTTLVCGALALAIAVSVLLRGRIRKPQALFAAFAADVGFWYLSQSLSGLYNVMFWKRVGVLLGVLLPVFACNLFEAMVPDEDPKRRHSRFGRLSLLLALPMLAIAFSPALQFTIARVGVFVYAVAVIALGLWELGQRGLHSRSRATQRRVRFLVITGALAGLFSLADFVWVIGYEPAYYPTPVGVVLSVVFLFMLAQALRHERLLDLYEMLARLLVATALAFLIAGVFYLLVTVVGQFNTMWLNAIVAAIVVLVLFNPMREWVERRMQRIVFREGRRLEASLAKARRRLAHTLEIEELGNVVMHALERARTVTTAALYLRHEAGTAFDTIATLGSAAPQTIEVATANALLEQLEHGPVILEQVKRDVQTGHPTPRRHVSAEAVFAAAEVLGSLRDYAVVLAVHSDEGELIGLLVVADERIGDAFSPEDVALLDKLAAQIGVVVENSQLYARMKERDRLAVLGQMAAGLAHEIRNPLGAIKGAAQLLSDPKPGANDQEFLGIILEEVERLDAVVGSVLDLARQKSDEVAPIDVNGVVKRTLQVMSADWDEDRVKVETLLEEDLARAAIPPDQLRQVMMNLLRNAVQAMGGRGTVRLTTRTRSGTISLGVQAATRSEAGTGRAGRPDSWVVIAITDHGPGIPAQQLESIFLPFFTTKDDGTGLGLAISQRIVQTAGGRIDVRSRTEPGAKQGTTIEVVLPSAMEALGTPAPAEGAAVAPPEQSPKEVSEEPQSQAGPQDVAAGEVPH
jgi:two-component system sensor histidine kinase HydH